MTDPVNVRCPACASSPGDPCRNRYAKAKPTCAARTKAAATAGAKPSAPAPKPDDFTEVTPPPRTRPIGVPVPAYYVLPPGEDVRALFAEWVAAGRLPAGAVLCDWRPGLRGPTGSRVAVTVVVRQYGSPKWVVLVPQSKGETS